MKKLLLSLLFIGGMVSANAQCTPDPQYTLPGIYPDTATGLADAFVGQMYDEVITVIVPADTTVDNPLAPGTQITVDLNSIVLDSVKNLPPNFTYECSPSNCTFNGGSTGCIRLYSTVDPVVGDIGLYVLSIFTTANATTQGFPPIPVSQNDEITAYSIEVKNGGPVGILERTTSATLRVSDVAPNPVVGRSRVQVLSGTSGIANVRITNLLGAVVKSETIQLTANGVSDYFINSDDFNSGIYLISVTNGENSVTKKMTIRK